MANSKEEFDDIAQEGEETLMFPQDYEGTRIYLRPIMHGRDLCTQEEIDRLADEMHSIDNNQLYCEQGIISFANNLNDNTWLADILDVDESSLHEVDVGTRGITIYGDEWGEEWYTPVTLEKGRNLSAEEIENKPEDFQKRLGAWAWMNNTPEPVQATIENQLISRESALVSSGRSMRMGKEIAEEAEKTDEDELHLYHGANHLVGIYSYLENSEVGDKVYDELGI